MVPVKSEGYTKPLDIETPQGEEEVFLAAQLSRIVSRILENKAFESLQKALNEQRTYKSPEDAKEIVFQLGRVLVQFRWRIAWWNVHGTGGPNDDISKQRYIQRLTQLTRMLYFYFCSAKRKLPNYLALADLQGTEIPHSGGTPFFDNFPHDYTIEGWEAWMEQGNNLVRRAIAERNNIKVDPLPPKYSSSSRVTGEVSLLISHFSYLYLTLSSSQWQIPLKQPFPIYKKMSMGFSHSSKELLELRINTPT